MKLFHHSIKFYPLLKRKEKTHLIYLSISLLLGMLLEATGIGIILPLIDLIIDPQKINESFFYKNFIKIFNLENTKNATSLFLLFIFIFYFLKGIFLVSLVYFQNNFLQKLRARISINLYTSYLYSSYQFHTKKNSGVLLKHIQTDVSYFITYFTSFINIITETALISSILLSVIYINPTGSIVAGIAFAFMAFIFNLSVKKKISTWGDERSKLENINSKILLEGIRGFKELQLFNRANYYIGIYNKNMNQLTKIVSKVLTINLTPRYYLEITAISVLLGFLFYSLYEISFSDNLVTTFAIFVAAIFKVIPSINKILASFQNFNFYSKSVNVLKNQLLPNEKQKVKQLNTGLKFNNEIWIKKLSFNYTDEKNQVLKNVNMKIRFGETVGIFGPSGSGKSTLIDLFVGLHYPTSGKIIIDGEYDLFENLNNWRSKIGYIPQHVFLTDNKIINNIAFGLPESEIEINKVNKAIKLAQLGKFIDKLPNGLYTNVGESGFKLSGGQRQRIGIARALYNDPEILIMDEATSSLDTKTESEVMYSIEKLKKKKTIIIVAHRLNTLDRCDTLYEVNNGEVTFLNNQN